MILVDGSTGLEISRIEGDQNEDQLGQYRIFEVSGGRYVIRSPGDNAGAITKAGSIIFVDSATGSELTRFSGNRVDDQLSLHRYMSIVSSGTLDSQGVLELPNGNIVITNNRNDKDTLIDSGSAILLKGSDLSEISRTEGEKSDDRIGWRIFVIDDSRYVLINPWADSGGFVNNGSVMIVNANTGAILKKIVGKNNESQLGIKFFAVTASLNYLYISDSAVGAESIKAEPL